MTLDDLDALIVTKRQSISQLLSLLILHNEDGELLQDKETKQMVEDVLSAWNECDKMEQLHELMLFNELDFETAWQQLFGTTYKNDRLIAYVVVKQNFMAVISQRKRRLSDYWRKHEIASLTDEFLKIEYDRLLHELDTAVSMYKQLIAGAASGRILPDIRKIE